MKKQRTNYEQKSRHCGRAVSIVELLDPQSPAKNTSPTPSKGGEKTTLTFVRNVSVRKQLPLFWRGLGGGPSGLPRRSYLTARNDDVPFSELCVSFANLALKKIKPQRTQRKNLVNLENLNKILVQNKNK